MEYSKADIKKIVRISKKIETHKKRGYNGVDINIKFCCPEQGRRIRAYFEPSVVKYIDWNTDDCYGFGVGYNRNGAYNKDFLSISWVDNNTTAG